MDTTSLVLYGVPATAIIIALTKVASGAGLPKQWCPVLAVILGMLAGVLYALPTFGSNTANVVGEGIIRGIVTGLAAAGIYDFGVVTALPIIKPASDPPASDPPPPPASALPPKAA